ncbi:MAG: preprotein translocase subunit YajC [Syntrophorhabdus aromaticivorans]|uniref:Sec translocon accessory complex subunit YajC n=2 Tax=Syntrophorhabdus aromaticivorans TaxID=328301 RepID=A0A351U7U2_9BACT|nr:preprotein translocase subunit YajC [Syntrophorhabdus aromaticivorans]HBA56023.1 preprotein translocase subunit YajC [Syntrophorhabdus aromaticivorans]
MNTAYAMGTQAASGQGGSQWMGLLPLVLLFVVFYFLLIRPQQKRAKQQKQFLESLKKGDEVITTGGLYGKITGITDDTVTIEVAEKVRVRVAKSAVAQQQHA